MEMLASVARVLGKATSKLELGLKVESIWLATAKPEPVKPGTQPKEDTMPVLPVDPTLGALPVRVPLLATMLVLDTPKVATTLLRVVSRLDGMLPQVVLKPVTMLEHLVLKLAGMQALLALRLATTPVLLLARLAGMLDPLVFKAVLVLDTTLVSKPDRLLGELVTPVHPVPKLAGTLESLVPKPVQTLATMLAFKLVKPHGEQPTLVSTPLAMSWEELISDSTWVWEEEPMPVELVVLDSEDRPALVLATKLLPR